MKRMKDMKGSLRSGWVLFPSFMIFMTFMVPALGQDPQQKPPVFRSRIDLMQLDVTVLDKTGQPVRGLTKEDFTLHEDNTPQTIQGFAAIDLPGRVVGGPVWQDTVASDVVTNDIENARIFVLVMDDALSMGTFPPPSPPNIPDPAAIERMKDGAVSFLTQLGPLDLAAVVFTQRTRMSQNLTADKARLIAAIRAFPSSGGGDLNPTTMLGRGGGVTTVPGTACLGRIYSVGAMEGTVKLLAALPDRRKAIVYFGGQLPWANGPDDCTIFWRWRDTFANAQQANVTINPVDTMGLRTERPLASWATYGAVAENTGGHAVIGNNDLKPGLNRIMTETSSYYLLAYQPTRDIADGTFRRLTVRINRPDVEVISRRNYWAPRAKRDDEPPPPVPPPDLSAMAGLLPKADLKLRATAAPFAVAGTEKAVVAVTVGVRQPALMSRTPDNVEILVRAFTADGDTRGSETQTIPVTVPAARGGAEISRYDLLARIELPRPGKYELRLSAHSTISDTRGSVYVDVDVPDFRRDKISLSGLVLNALPGTGPVAPSRALIDLTPIAPTTERTLGSGDLVTAFVRIYQGGNDRLAEVTLQLRILDAAGKAVFAKSEMLDAARFTDTRAADHQFRVPLAGLSAGPHLLTIEATLGKLTVKRDVVFEIK